VKIYNEEQPHMSIEMITPKEATLPTEEITKR